VTTDLQIRGLLSEMWYKITKLFPNLDVSIYLFLFLFGTNEIFLEMNKRFSLHFFFFFLALFLHGFGLSYLKCFYGVFGFENIMWAMSMFMCMIMW
jgi:hypothetical protein